MQITRLCRPDVHFDYHGALSARELRLLQRRTRSRKKTSVSRTTSRQRPRTAEAPGGPQRAIARVKREAEARPLQRDNDIPKKVIIENSEVQERGKEKSIKVAKYGQELFRNSNCIILDEDGPTPRGALWMHHGTITSIYKRYPDMPIVQPEWTKMSTGTAEEQKKSVYDWERYMSQIVRPHLIAKRLNAKATIDPQQQEAEEAKDGGARGRLFLMRIC